MQYYLMNSLLDLVTLPKLFVLILEVNSYAVALAGDAVEQEEGGE